MHGGEELSMLQKGIRAYTMGLLALLGAATGYLATEFIRNPASLELLLSDSSGRILLGVGILFIILLVTAPVPALLIYRRDERHFGWAGARRWLALGFLLGVYLRVITFWIPDVDPDARIGVYFFNRAVTWVVGAVGLLAGYWLIFRRQE